MENSEKENNNNNNNKATAVGRNKFVCTLVAKAANETRRGEGGEMFSKPEQQPLRLRLAADLLFA